ncbi:hypothetical protein QCA50_015601 [Cerrena zonata]|uniref:Uncharacterized protein n=1 Tax=Cerrena zonata TaxID=2478898 RepID=A0AAW0FQK1_9APHY
MSSSLQNAASKSQATLNVSITANDENYEREQLEKEQRRQKLEQNALPSWHSASTVGKMLGKLDSEESSKETTPTIKEESTDIKEESSTPQIEPSDQVQSTPANLPTLDSKDQAAQDVLAAYYADLAEREADDDDDDEEEDDFDEFEDV